MKIIVLGAGAGPDPEIGQPALLLEHGSGLLIEQFVSACAGLDAGFVFAVRAQDIRRFHIGNIIELAAPGAAIVRISGETQGAACTALLCIHHIELDQELLILNSNEFLDIDYTQPVRRFREQQLDAGVVTFPSLHPRYSYVRLDDAGMIEEASEKRPISRHAMAGFFWFRRGQDFVAGAEAMIAKDVQVDEKYYISLVLNELVLAQRRLGTFPIETKQYRPLKSRRQMDLYEADGAGAQG
jgi:hypothetical protein